MSYRVRKKNLTKKSSIDFLIKIYYNIYRKNKKKKGIKMYKSKLTLWDEDIEKRRFYYELKRTLWEEARINLIVNLRRNEKEIGEIKFIVSPSEYKDIMNLRGIHCGRLIKNDQDIVINLFPSDILIIAYNDYPEIKKNFDKKYKEYDKIEVFK